MTPAEYVFDAIQTARSAEREREMMCRHCGETARAAECAYAQQCLGRLMAVLRTGDWERAAQMVPAEAEE